MQVDEEIKKYVEKIKQMEKSEKLDLSSDEDLSMAVINLISLEEHFYFTYNKTKNDVYLDMLGDIRDMRKSLLKKLVKNTDGEVWCISKHLLATTMRLMEVGTKALAKGDKQEAKVLFDQSYQIYSLFWGLNLGLVTTPQSNPAPAPNHHPGNIAPPSASISDSSTHHSNHSGLLNKLGTLVQKMIDCCKE